MNANDAIRWMLEKAETSQQTLSEMLGAKSVSKVSMMLQGNPSAQSLARVADLLGFDLTLVDRRDGAVQLVKYDPGFKSGRSKK